MKGEGMEEINTNLFGDEAGEVPGLGVEVEKAKQEIDKTTALLKAAPDIPDAEEVGRSRAMAARVMKLAQDMNITDQASYEQGVALAKACTVAIQSVEKPEKDSRMAKVQEQKENAHSLHKFFTGLISSLVDPYKQARTIADGKTTKWYREETERRRKEAERVRRAEEKRLEDEKLARAIELEQSGNADDKAEAEAVLAEPVYVAPVPVVAPKAEGSTHIAKWTFEVTDIMALLRAIVEGKENASLVTVNEKALGAMARSQKEAAKVTGIRFYDAGTVRHSA
jgi:hypothetical protein